VGPKRRVDVLLALLGTTPDDPISGEQVTARLAAGGRRIGPSKLLATLLDLEASGHVVVARGSGYHFSLSPIGQRAAYEAGPGRALDLTVLMVDLVGFTTYTADHGDGAARDAARQLELVARDELHPLGGRVVKSLGDGVLGVAPPRAEVVGALRRVRERVAGIDGTPWSMRAGIHDGRPIEHDGDVFGADVNLVARLCEAAAPDQIVRSVDAVTAGAELVTVKGLATPVSVIRMALA
jgi:class 3 adenylate cyclase